MFLLRPEISLNASVNPRKWLNNHFQRIKKDKHATLGRKCEVCGNPEGLIDIHESFTIENYKYILLDFVLLCRDCHLCHVHAVKYNSEYILYSRGHLARNLWKKPKFQLYSGFDNEDRFSEYLACRHLEVIKFILADTSKISFDFSVLSNYGIDEQKTVGIFRAFHRHPDLKFNLLWYLHSERIIDDVRISRLTEQGRLVVGEYLKHYEFLQNLSLITNKTDRKKELEIYAEAVDILNTAVASL